MRDVRWVYQGLVKDLAVHERHIFLIKRGERCQHFVEQDSKRPPVNLFTVGLSLQNFGGWLKSGVSLSLMGVENLCDARTQVLGSAAESIGLSILNLICLKVLA